MKNSYNVRAPGTLIGHKRPGGSEGWLLTSIVRKKNVTMLDIVSTRMLGQYGFLAKVFTIMNNNGISVDCVATSEVSVSLTLDPAKLWSRDLVKDELEELVKDFEENGIARVTCTTGHSLISLIGGGGAGTGRPSGFTHHVLKKTKNPLNVVAVLSPVFTSC